MVDDHALVRAGVTGVSNGTKDIQVVGECTDGHQVSTAATALQPDVVLMDVVMPTLSGIEAMSITVPMGGADHVRPLLVDR